jgi:hypothetical protein
METIEGWLSVDGSEAAAERTEHLARVRADVRRDNPRLTEEQIDLIAAVAAEIRFAREQLFARRREQHEAVA